MTAKRALLLGLLTWASYLFFRTYVQQLIPYADWPGYARQDLVITALRLACAGSALWIATRRWKGAALGLGSWQMGGPLAWTSAGLLVAALWLGSFSMMSTPGLYWVRAVELGIAVVVALNEELGFRGLFYCAARELWGRRAAVWGTSLAFAAMHAGYQPWFHLMETFFVGLALAYMRDRGTSLAALVALHFVLDAPYAIFLSGGAVQHWGIYYTGVGLAALAVLPAWRQEERLIPGAGELVFVYGSLKRGRWGAKETKMENRADLVGFGSMQGRLFDLGDYPGAVQGEGRVPGELWRLRDTEFLKTLDGFEGEEFLRDETDVQMADGRRVAAWAWIYTGPQHSHKELAGGW